MHRRAAPTNSTSKEDVTSANTNTFRSATKRNAVSSSSSSKSGMLILLIIIIAGLVGLVMYQNNASKQEIDIILRDENVQMGRMKSELELQKSVFEEEKRKLQNEVKAIAAEMKMKAAVSKDAVVKEEKEDQSEFLRGQVDHLKEEMQKSAKFNVLEKFGKGPHRIEIQLEFPPEEIPDGTADKFVIEMAPLDLMPYTVNYFMEQVSRGLFDGSSFHRNAGHVVQGGPTPNHTNHGTNLNRPFHDAGLVSVGFQEYSAKFPHVKYTLGYAGRPGGPDFYVSTIDNTRNHGPGGQGSYEVKDEADPCFAKVVEGFEAVDRMHKMSRQPGGYQRMKHYVAIIHAKILN